MCDLQKCRFQWFKSASILLNKSIVFICCYIFHKMESQQYICDFLNYLAFCKWEVISSYTVHSEALSQKEPLDHLRGKSERDLSKLPQPLIDWREASPNLRHCWIWENSGLFSPSSEGPQQSVLYLAIASLCLCSQQREQYGNEN